MNVTSHNSQTILVKWQVNIRFILTKTPSSPQVLRFSGGLPIISMLRPKTITLSLLRCADLSLAPSLSQPPPLRLPQSSVTPKLRTRKINGDCVGVWFPQTEKPVKPMPSFFSFNMFTALCKQEKTILGLKLSASTPQIYHFEWILLLKGLKINIGIGEETGY